MDNNDFERRCPLCRGMLLENVCIDCGFKSLTEEEITAPYDFVPYNDSFGEAETAEDNEEMESISVIDEEIVLSAESSDIVQKKSSVKTVSHTVKSNSVSTGSSFKDPTASEITEIVAKDFVEAVKKHWWKMLITLIFPIIGFAIGLGYAMLGFGSNRHSKSLDFDIVMIFKGIGYMSAAGLLMKLGIGFTFM